jgi:hypothetical protein
MQPGPEIHEHSGCYPAHNHNKRLERLHVDISLPKIEVRSRASQREPPNPAGQKKLISRALG